jgi:hypothetical protein
LPSSFCARSSNRPLINWSHEKLSIGGISHSGKFVQACLIIPPSFTSKQYFLPIELLPGGQAFPQRQSVRVVNRSQHHLHRQSSWNRFLVHRQDQGTRLSGKGHHDNHKGLLDRVDRSHAINLSAVGLLFSFARYPQTNSCSVDRQLLADLLRT